MSLQDPGAGDVGAMMRALELFAKKGLAAHPRDLSRTGAQPPDATAALVPAALRRYSGTSRSRSRRAPPSRAGGGGSPGARSASAVRRGGTALREFSPGDASR